MKENEEIIGFCVIALHDALGPELHNECSGRR
jgi:hypothetical protein